MPTENKIETTDAGHASVQPAPAQGELPAPTAAAVPAEVEQAAFEEWIARVCPSGDVDSVSAQWLESSDYADLFDAPSPEVVERDQVQKMREALTTALERWALLASDFKDLQPEYERELSEIATCRAALSAQGEGGAQ